MKPIYEAILDPTTVIWITLPNHVNYIQGVSDRRHEAGIDILSRRKKMGEVAHFPSSSL
jgi:hypothetical protein